MNFLSTIILIMSKYILCVNVMLLLPSIESDEFFLPKVSLPECRFVTKFAPENLPNCFTCV